MDISGSYSPNNFLSIVRLNGFSFSSFCGVGGLGEEVIVYAGVFSMSHYPGKVVAEDLSHSRL